MKLITATVTSQPRTVNTKFGQRAVMDCRIPDGQEVAIWRNAGDLEVLGRRPGERVTLSLDSKGKYSLVETASTHLADPYATATATLDRPRTVSPVPVKSIAPTIPDTAPTDEESFLSPGEKKEIASYISEMAKLYGFCLKKSENLAETSEDRRAIATTLFISAQRKFSL